MSSSPTTNSYRKLDRVIAWRLAEHAHRLHEPLPLRNLANERDQNKTGLDVEALRAIGKRIWRAWVWLWTGHDSIAAKRRALEQDVHRFGGRVTWRDP